MNLLSNAKQELARLKAELAANPTYQVIQQLEALIPTLEAAERSRPQGSFVTHVAMPTPGGNGTVFVASHQGRQTSRKAKIKSTIKQMMMQQSVVQRQAILTKLAELNILSGPKAVKVLAPILSQAKEFTTDGKGGWSLSQAGQH